MSASFPIPPGAAIQLPPPAFNSLMSAMGQRISWFKSHACPCVFAAAVANGPYPLPGSAQRSCKTCLGLGVYWDAPGLPFRAWMKFVEMSPTPDEPGVRTDAAFGLTQLSEPGLSIPYNNPTLGVGDPTQPTIAWNDASTYDIFVPVDMLARFTAKLEVGGIQYLPFQQNLQIKPTGAVTVWDPVNFVVDNVTNYAINGANVSITGYPDGTVYMVEFYAAPMFVAFRPAGGVPHIRPFSGGTVQEPRRFKLQLLDFWLRQRGQGQTAAGTVSIAGTAFPTIIATGNVT